ncbi:hypothetical protein PMAYCL1PPCAC_30558, partial [Pristionchus mayeri]
EERLYNFRKQQREAESMELSSSGYRIRTLPSTIKSPIRKSTDKSYRESGRDIFGGFHTWTGLVSTRSPEHSRSPATRLSRGGQLRRTVSRPEIQKSSRSVEPPRQSSVRKPPVKPRGKSSPPSTAATKQR